MNFQKYILWFVLLMASYSLHANKQIDSLLNVLKTKKLTSEEKCFIYGDIAWEFTNINVDSAEIFAKKEMDLAQKIKNTGRYCDALNTLGIISQYRNDYRSALDYYHTALKEFTKIKDTAWIASLYNNIAIIYQFQHNYKLALKYTFEGLKTYRMTDDTRGIANSYANVGLTFAYMNDYENAGKYYDTTLRLQMELKNMNGVANTYLNWGSIYADQKNYEKAEELFRKSLEYADKKDYPHAYYTALGDLGQMRGKLGSTDEALKLCTESMEYAEKFGLTEILMTDCFCLYEAYKNKGNHARANGFLERYMELKDSSSNQQLTAELSMKDAELNYSLKFTEDSLLREKEKEITDTENNAKLEKKQILQYTLIGGLILVLVSLIFIYNRFKKTQKQKNIIELKEKETNIQKQIIQEKNKEIIDSINYAKRIQYTLLAQEDLLSKNLNEHFVLFMPKDIVSGDFYWATKKGNDFYLAICDCTGHGVPGAFMSLLNISLLNEAINEIGITEPHLVLNFVRENIIKTMEGSKDGMDATLVKFTNGKMQYASAHNRPVLIRNGELKELPADKMPVGMGEDDKSFTLQQLDLKKGDLLCFYTDGYADQFGGPKGKKFKYSNLQKLLLEKSDLELSALNNQMETIISQWKGDLEQVDDICLIGIRI